MSSYLGLDLSLTETGIVLLDEHHTVIEATYVKTKPPKTVYERADIALDAIMDVVRGVINLRVFVEGYAMGAKGQVFTIAEFSGIIKHRLALHSPNVEFFLQIPPSSVKKFITGTGAAKKELMMKELYKRYNVDYDNNNIADAHALAEMGYAICNSDPDTLPKYQQDAIAAVLKTAHGCTHVEFLQRGIKDFCPK